MDALTPRCGLLLLAAALWPLATCATPGATSSAPQPNVILLMADDLGWGDVGFNGNATIRTPHLDAMAGDGLVFERFYAQSPVCSPTRSSCLTGRHPFRDGVTTANVGHLPLDVPSLPGLLGERGYATGHFGKWHLGTLAADYSGKRNRNPERHHLTPAMAGFDTWFATEYAVSTWDPYDPEHAHGAYDVRNLYWADGKNLTDVAGEGLAGDDSRIVMDRVLPFVAGAVERDEPFFAVVWFHAPHLPVVGGPEYLALYPEVSEDEQHYYACITAMDEQVGRLRAELAALGVAEDTLLAFCSDNGPEGNPGPKARSQGSAGPFRGRKRSLYEGGVRVPACVVWPGRVPAGARTAVAASTSDYLPTLVELLGLEPVEGLDGASIGPLLLGQEQRRSEPLYFQTDLQQVAMGEGFKLVRNLAPARRPFDNGAVPFAEWELYDLLEDPGETRNVIEGHREAVEVLRGGLEAFVESCERDARRLDAR